jgi:probable HAF family extracellular repeat protein
MYSMTSLLGIRGMRVGLAAVASVATGLALTVWPAAVAAAAPAGPPSPYVRTQLLGTFQPSKIGNSINRNGLVAGTVRVGLYDRAATYNTTTGALTVLPTLGGTSARGSDINSAGYVVGSSDTLAGDNRPFLWNPKTNAITNLGSLGGGYGNAFSLNDNGYVVGESFTAGGQSHAFIWSAKTGLMKDLGTLGGPYSAAYSINSAGYVVGSAFNKTDGGRAFIWNPATNKMTDLGVLPGKNLSVANDINDSNVVVGDSFTASDDSNRPFIWAPGLRAPTALPGAFAFGTATAIAVDGTAVGTVSEASFSPRAVIWKNYGLNIFELNSPAGNSDAVAINKNNRIVGNTALGLTRWDP